MMYNEAAWKALIAILDDHCRRYQESDRAPVYMDFLLGAYVGFIFRDDPVAYAHFVKARLAQQGDSF